MPASNTSNVRRITCDRTAVSPSSDCLRYSNRASKGRVIDVGSDHGLLALNCLKRELTPFCICTDIHSAPAARTAECLSSYNLDERFEVFCTDGLDGVDLKKDDTVVMAGLGGNTAVDVMTRAMKLTSEDTLREIDFVLQPQKSQDRVREFLYSNGFAMMRQPPSTATCFISV